MTIYKIINEISGTFSDVKGFVPIGLCVLHAVALQQEGHVFGGWGLFCVELTCFPSACVDFLWVLQLHPTVQKHAFGGMGG